MWLLLLLLNGLGDGGCGSVDVCGCEIGWWKRVEVGFQEGDARVKHLHGVDTSGEGRDD